ncbi:hypothetical protein BDA99DRAFT_560659 [Phascolomyces articulosus]|uniref:Uncharacterized protein n=1 Tax=Phascolomyces articulosus TaxID=60185 RepID=A0AAD5PCX9_9FUNG|nr:hypothetical protein BDA99DRAFT_560659 [Phascolomyces articulosus]
MVKTSFLVAATTCMMLFASGTVYADDQAKCKCENTFAANTALCCGLFPNAQYRPGGGDCLFPNRLELPQMQFLGCCQQPNSNLLGSLDDSEHNFGQCGD